ncbi:MAG: hypothetical protein R2698_01170 [Microthrixaceae bacterium]
MTPTRQEPELARGGPPHRDRDAQSHRRDPRGGAQRQPQQDAHVASGDVEDRAVVLKSCADEGEGRDVHHVGEDGGESRGTESSGGVEVGGTQGGDAVEEDLGQQQVEQVEHDPATLAAAGIADQQIDRGGTEQGHGAQQHRGDETDRQQRGRGVVVAFGPGPDERGDQRGRQDPADHELEHEVRCAVRLGVQVGEGGLADRIGEDEDPQEPREA